MPMMTDPRVIAAFRAMTEQTQPEQMGMPQQTPEEPAFDLTQTKAKIGEKLLNYFKNLGSDVTNPIPRGELGQDDVSKLSGESRLRQNLELRKQDEPTQDVFKGIFLGNERIQRKMAKLHKTDPDLYAETIYQGLIGSGRTPEDSFLLTRKKMEEDKFRAELASSAATTGKTVAEGKKIGEEGKGLGIDNEIMRRATAPNASPANQYGNLGALLAGRHGQPDGLRGISMSQQSDAAGDAFGGPLAIRQQETNQYNMETQRMKLESDEKIAKLNADAQISLGEAGVDAAQYQGVFGRANQEASQNSMIFMPQDLVDLKWRQTLIDGGVPGIAALEPADYDRLEAFDTWKNKGIALFSAAKGATDQAAASAKLAEAIAGDENLDTPEKKAAAFSALISAQRMANTDLRSVLGGGAGSPSAEGGTQGNQPTTPFFEKAGAGLRGAADTVTYPFNYLERAQDIGMFAEQFKKGFNKNKKQ